MTTIEILKDTFKATGTYNTDEVGTVEVTCGNQRLTLPAHRTVGGPLDGEVSVAEFVGRYQTSSKAWRAHLYTMRDRTCANFGRDDRSGRFNKLHGISHEPVTFWKDHPNPAYYGR